MINFTSRIYNDGDIINDIYRVIKQVGRGGFAQVFLVEDTNNDDKKLIVKALVPNERNRDHPRINEILDLSYEREKQALREAESLNITPNLIEHLDNQKYIVEEYIEGKTLEQYLENPELQKFSIREITELLKNWLNKLKQFHSCGLVHRDIGSSNIICRNDKIGNLVFIDLGTAKNTNNEILAENLEAQHNLEYQRTEVVYNQRYVAPERLRNYSIDNRELTEQDRHNHYRIDIFSLGIIFTEILEKLVLDSDITTTVYRFLKEDRPNGEENKLISILQKMTHYNCFERYQSVDEVLRDIEEFEQEIEEEKSNTLTTFIIPELPNPPEPVDRLDDSSGNVHLNQGNNSPESGGGKPPKTKWWNKNKGLLLVISGACLSLGLIGFVYWLINREPDPPTSPTTTSICPSNFETRVTWGGKYLSSNSETIPPVVEEAIENLNEACTESGDGKNQQKLEDSIPLFEAAKDGFQQAVQQQPQNGQLLTFLHNTEIFLEEANEAKDTRNYTNTTQIIAVATSIDVDSGNDNELRNPGNSILIGSLMYVENLKNQKIILLITDDQNDSSTSNNVNQEIIAELTEKVPNLLGVIGHALSLVTKVVLPFYEEAGILLITPSSTANEINPNNYDRFKRVVISNNEIAKGLKIVIENQVQLTPESKVTILYQDETYGQDLSEQINEELKELNEENRPKNIILKPMDSKVAQFYEEDVKDAQVVVLIPNGYSREIILGILALIDDKTLIIAPDSAFNPFTTQKINQSCMAKGMLVVTPYFDSTFSQKVEEFIQLKSPNYQLNKENILGWQKLELKDWRIPHSYVAARSILWVNEKDYNNGIIQDITGKIQFDSQTGSLAVGDNKNDIENYINIYEVTSECKFKRK